MEEGLPLIENLTAEQVQQAYIHHRLWHPNLTYYIVSADDHTKQIKLWKKQYSG